MAVLNLLFRGLILLNLTFSSFAYARDACGINSGSDPFLYEVVRRSYVYSQLHHQGRIGTKVEDCAPLNAVTALFEQAGRGIEGCHAIANCGFIRQRFEDLAKNNWALGHAREDECFRSPDSLRWDEKVCADIDLLITEGNLPCPKGRTCNPMKHSRPKVTHIVATPLNAPDTIAPSTTGSGDIER